MRRIIKRFEIVGARPVFTKRSIPSLAWKVTFYRRMALVIRSTRRSTTIIESWSCGRLYYKLTLLLLFIFYFIAIHQLKKSRNWKITTSHVTRRLSSHFCVFHCHRNIKPINIEICFLKTFLDRNTSLIGYF